MGSLIVVTGPPGAGKSSVGKCLAQRFERSVFIEGDAFFGFLERGSSDPWTPEAGYQNSVVIRAAASAAGQYVSGGYATVYEGVVGPWFLPTFAAATGLDHLHYVVLLPSVERCVERVKTRQAHEFTDEAATIHMHREFVKSEIDPHHVFVEPPDGVEVVVERILAELESNALVYRSPLPNA